MSQELLLIVVVAGGMLLATCLAAGEEQKMVLEVPAVLVEAPQDGFVVNCSPEALAALREHQVAVNGKPADGSEISLWGAKCEWVMPTPQAGEYVVSLFMTSGDKRTGKFGYNVGSIDHTSPEFSEKGGFVGCLKAFRIIVPRGQPQTRMFLAGSGLYFARADISRAAPGIEKADGRIKEIAASSYRTVLRGAIQTEGRPACMVLIPDKDPEARLARKLSERLNLPVAHEPEPKDPFPAYPKVQGATPQTNLILLSAGVGGPLVRAMRRAELIAENHAIPGPGGYVIRTVPRPLEGKGNVIVISGGDEEGLAKGVAAFQPKADDRTGELLYDRFLVDSPGERWAKLRDSCYRISDGSKWWDEQIAELGKPYAGIKSGTPARAYISRTSSLGDRYWWTGKDKFAELFKRYLFKMEDDDIYGGKDGQDSHMQLYGLIRAWDRCEESPVFSPADRLRITNYLLLRCVEGNEGFARSYCGYQSYSGPVLMRHNHQTILGCGLMQAYLYYGRLYGLGRAKMWKSWCDDLIANGTRWGHAPENSPNYEPLTFMEVADMLRCQGLSTKGPEGTRTWPEAALRLYASYDSFSLPGCYGDCWSNDGAYGIDFIRILRDDWDWPAGQWCIDRLIRSYRHIDPKSSAAGELYAYLHGSTDVGGLLKPPDETKSREILRPLVGLSAIPMTEGYWKYMAGQVGNKSFWDKAGRPEAIPYERTADKAQYRSGWDANSEYLLLETLGWCDHGHMDLGTIVQYCQGGRLWVVDFGYNNVEPVHHSTLEVSRDGKPAWGSFKDLKGRWGDFRAGPQMFEIVPSTAPSARSGQAASASSGEAGRFSIVCRAKNLAGATWLRGLSGGDGKPLTIEDTLTADEPGEYEAVFRLRLLGDLGGQAGKWAVKQKGAVLPVILDVQTGDETAIGKWMPDSHAWNGGAYSWYPFAGDGIPKTLEWKRKVKLDRGQSTIFQARLGPCQESP